VKLDKDTVFTVIFEAETPAGKTFDVALIIAILVSVLAVMLDTVPRLHAQYGDLLYAMEWAFTMVFMIEYGLRLWCINDKSRYAFSFYGVIDLLGILPTFVSLFYVGAQHLLVIRIIRVLRVFRVLRMMRYVGEANMLRDALISSQRKITVFLLSVAAMVVVFGSLMYLIEGAENGFTSIPKSMYWAVITLTTVGYGDITPQTPFGQFIASLVMISGYAIIAVPTGIVTMGLVEAGRKQEHTRTCPDCSAEGHASTASFCWRCGHTLQRKEVTPPSRSGGDVEPGLAGIPQVLRVDQPTADDSQAEADAGTSEPSHPLDPRA
jgi:voltage-gated potassium channel